MSTIDDILVRTTDLVEKLTELIATDTVQALPGVAAELGVTEILNSAVDLLVTALDGLVRELGKLDSILTQMGGIRGLIGLLDPLLVGLGGVVSQTAQNFEAYGLDENVANTITTGVSYVSTTLSVIRELLIEPETFQELVAGIDSLKGQFADLAARELPGESFAA
jgi:hypothetical protein